MAKLKVYVKNNQTEVKVPVGIRLLIRRCCQAVLTTENFGKDAEVSVSFVSNNEIKNLNKIYRNKDSVTDVLSFPLTSEDGTVEVNPETGAVQLGDVVISLETAVKQAQNYGHSLEREVGFLTVHSMLHLLGYDHETSQLDQRIMREKEKPLSELAGLLVPFPQTLINVRVERRLPFEERPIIGETVSKIEAALAGRGRVLLRYSGTESLCRVMVEGENPVKVKAYAEELAQVVERELR